MLQCGTILGLCCQLQRSYKALFLHLRAQKYANQTSFDVFYTLHVLCKSTAKYVTMPLDVNCKIRTTKTTDTLFIKIQSLMLFKWFFFIFKVNYQYQIKCKATQLCSSANNPSVVTKAFFFSLLLRLPKFVERWR